MTCDVASGRYVGKEAPNLLLAEPEKASEKASKKAEKASKKPSKKAEKASAMGESRETGGQLLDCSRIFHRIVISPCTRVQK